MSNSLRISNLLKDLGISPVLSGYKYLRYAIELATDDPSFVSAFTKRLYPSVAEHFNTTPSRAERGMRHGIETGWHRGNEETQSMLFGYTVSSDKGNPTNGEFISTVTDYLLLQEENHGS